MEMIDVVIRIPKQLHDDIKKSTVCGEHGVVRCDLLDTIADGIVLSQGHGRLIDADAKDLQSELWTFTRYTGIDEAPYEDACMALDKAPTIVEADGGVE